MPAMRPIVFDRLWFDPFPVFQLHNDPTHGRDAVFVKAEFALTHHDRQILGGGHRVAQGLAVDVISGIADGVRDRLHHRIAGCRPQIWRCAIGRLVFRCKGGGILASC